MTWKRKMKKHLIERLAKYVFIGIISILAILGIFLGIARATRSSRIPATTTASILYIEHKLTQYKMDTGAYPSTAQGLDALLEKPSINPPKNWKGPYIKDYLEDSWGEDFIYRFPGKHGRIYEIISEGPTFSPSDDIIKWK